MSDTVKNFALSAIFALVATSFFSIYHLSVNTMIANAALSAAAGLISTFLSTRLLRSNASFGRILSVNFFSIVAVLQLVLVAVSLSEPALSSLMAMFHAKFLIVGAAAGVGSYLACWRPFRI